MEQFPKGVDPRTLGIGHRERGPQRFSYTYADIAEAFGVRIETVKKWGYAGKLAPDDLGSICRWYFERLMSRSKGGALENSAPEPTSSA